jgi:hypothetical protein
MTYQKKTGFSLIEVLLATAVLSTVLIGLAMLLSYTIQSDTQARTKVTATDLAQAGSDFFRQERSKLGFNRLYLLLSEADSTICLNEISQSLEDHIEPGVNCYYGIEVEGIAVGFQRTASMNNLSEDLIDIEIEVSWLLDQDEPTRVSSVSSRLQLRPN